MHPDTTLSARRQRLVLQPPNRMREALLKRGFPGVDNDIVDVLSRMPGITHGRAKALLNLHSYDALQATILPRYEALNDFEAAAERLAKAVMKNETIGISGDYDCDGNCSVALMLRFLHASGVARERVHVHIPNREVEGYGVNRNAVQAMDGKHVSLLIALDNGTLAREPLGEAKRVGIDALVIDHHPNSLDHALPEGALVVNPRRADEALQNDKEGVADLAAVGMTWLMCRRTVQKLQEQGFYDKVHLPLPDPRAWLGLVATATIGDVVSMAAPLNRALVAEGLRVIHEGRDPYLTALAQTAQIDAQMLNEEHIAFSLAPIINAPGRLGQSIAWAFLSSEDASSTDTSRLLGDAQAQQDILRAAAAEQKIQLRRIRFLDENREQDRALDAAMQAPKIDSRTSNIVGGVTSTQQALMAISRQSNELRKTVEASVMRQARPMAQSWLKAHPDANILMLWGDHWHEGVIGIVAGRLKEEFGLPTLVASHDPQSGLCKASARSIRVAGHPVDIGQAVRDMAEKDGLLKKGGGHPMAAGMTFEYTKRDAVRARVEEKIGPASRAAREAQMQPLAFCFDARNADIFAHARHWAQAQERMRPFGEGFVKPRIGLNGFEVQHIRRSRDGRHIFFTLRRPLLLAEAVNHESKSYENIHCQAFHAAGTDVETMLRQASLSPAPFVLSGVLSLNDKEQGEPSLIFQLEDIQPQSQRYKNTSHEYIRQR